MSDTISSRTVSGYLAGNDYNLYVVDTGVADATMVEAGGQLFVSAGGQISGTVLSEDALEYVDSGGSATDTTVDP